MNDTYAAQIATSLQQIVAELQKIAVKLDSLISAPASKATTR
jgi:hypothetical protein